jgi:chromosome segregation ATPase
MSEQRSEQTNFSEMYALLTEMNGAIMAQLRAVNNNIGNVQRIMLDLNLSINNLITGLKDTRDKRYQEEIDSLEAQMKNLQTQIEDKRAAKTTTVTTSEKIRSVVTDMTMKQKLTEQERKQIDWIDVRNKVILVVITAIVLWILPKIGEWLQIIFAPK